MKESQWRIRRMTETQWITMETVIDSVVQESQEARQILEIISIEDVENEETLFGIKWSWYVYGLKLHGEKLVQLFKILGCNLTEPLNNLKVILKGWERRDITPEDLEIAIKQEELTPKLKEIIEKYR